MNPQSPPKPIAVSKPHPRRNDLTFWFLLPLCFAVGAGLAALIDGRFGPAGIVTLIGLIAAVAVAVLIWPGDH